VQRPLATADRPPRERARGGSGRWAISQGQGRPLPRPVVAVVAQARRDPRCVSSWFDGSRENSRQADSWHRHKDNGRALSAAFKPMTEWGNNDEKSTSQHRFHQRHLPCPSPPARPVCKEKHVDSRNASYRACPSLTRAADNHSTCHDVLRRRQERAVPKMRERPRHSCRGWIARKPKASIVVEYWTTTG
jgi:hypothetical protein